jgi:hypothetical protein
VKKLLVGLLLLAALPIAFVVGCGAKTSTPSSPAGPTATPAATPEPYATPQTTPQAMVVLNTAGNYVILSATGISNSGPSTTCGGFAVSPNGLTSVTGSPAIVESCGGVSDIADSASLAAQGDLGTAYTDATSRSGGVTLPSGADIGGQTLYPGRYYEANDLNLASADLHLDGQGNANAVFIFQVSGNLVVGPGRQVILQNGANAANIFWATAGYAALNTTVAFKGIIMAHTAVTFNTGAKLTGRALAQTANVTLLTNTITHP